LSLALAEDFAPSKVLGGIGYCPKLPTQYLQRKEQGHSPRKAQEDEAQAEKERQLEWELDE